MRNNTNLGDGIDMSRSDILLMVIVSAILIFAAYIFADIYGEEPVNFYGLDYLFEDPDSNVKIYSSGGFSLKNHAVGIMIFAHPEGEHYKMTVFVNGQVHRLLVDLFPIVEEESKSSVGADISRWDIPTEGRSDKIIEIPIDEPSPDRLDIIIEIPHSVEYKHDFSFDITAIDTEIASKTDQRLEGVFVTVEIEDPLGESVALWNKYKTDAFGGFGESLYIPDNAVLGQYTLNIIAEMTDLTPKNYSIPFFVMPLNSDSGSKCPGIYNWNGTHCVEDTQ